jgi:hypothetical protein
MAPSIWLSRTSLHGEPGVDAFHVLAHNRHLRLKGADAIYVFACDHPDARNAAIEIPFEFTLGGERIRRPGTRNASRHEPSVFRKSTLPRMRVCFTNRAAGKRAQVGGAEPLSRRASLCFTATGRRVNQPSKLPTQPTTGVKAQ